MATTQTIDQPESVVPDGAAGFYVSSSIQNGVYRVSSNGVLTFWAGPGNAGYSGDGGPATSAQLGDPIFGVAVDATGNLFIADSGNNRIRKVTPSVISNLPRTGGFAHGRIRMMQITLATLTLGQHLQHRIELANRSCSESYGVS